MERYTTEALKKKIKEFENKTEELISFHPDIKEISWIIENVPYVYFSEFRHHLNENITPGNEHMFVEQHNVGNRLFFTIKQASYGKSCEVTLYSKPVKFKHTYEGVEEI